ncbi:MAG: GDSL-type esterase/lipase family protein, partial [Pseudomonadota bacterium]
YNVTTGTLSGGYTQAITLTYTAASAGQTLTFRHTFQAGSGNITLKAASLQGEIAAFSLPYSDSFDTDFSAWTVVDETTNLGAWSVSGGVLNQSSVAVAPDAFDQTYHLGSNAVFNPAIAETDYRFGIDLQTTGANPQNDVGVLFRYADSDNYYRLSLSSRYGFTRLEKKVAGTFSTLAVSSRGFAPNQLYNVEVEAIGSTLLIWLDGDPLFAVDDSDLPQGTVGLYSQETIIADNMILEIPTTQPQVVLSSPDAHSVSSGTTITATAEVTNLPAGGYVEFFLDDADSVIDTTAPFSATYSSLSPGDYKVDAVARNSGDVELSRDTNVQVGIGGIYAVAVGDSIVQGFLDHFASDNTTPSGRTIASQGFEAVLTEQLDATTAVPNLVFNEGINGDTAVDTMMDRISSILERHPNLSRLTIGLGTNDSFTSVPTGRNCTGALCNGTFVGNLQSVIDQVIWSDYPTNSVSSGIAVEVSLIPPVFLSSNPWTHSSNNRIREMNDAIRFDVTGHSIGPDFFSFFLAGASENLETAFIDTIHPNALGYHLMGHIWRNSYDASNPQPLPLVLEDLSVSSGDVKQNLLEVGDEPYLDATDQLSSIPVDLQLGRWITPDNAQSGNTSASYLSFEVDRAVDVYVAYDAGAASLPNWMSSYINTGMTIGISGGSTPTYNLYRQSFAAGAVVLGGNAATGASGADDNYLTIVVEQ